MLQLAVAMYLLGNGLIMARYASNQECIDFVHTLDRIICRDWLETGVFSFPDY